MNIVVGRRTTRHLLLSFLLHNKNYTRTGLNYNISGCSGASMASSSNTPNKNNNDVCYGKPSFDASKFNTQDTNDTATNTSGNNGPKLYEQDPMIVAAEKSKFYKEIYDATVGKDHDATEYRIKSRTITYKDRTPVNVTVYYPSSTNKDDPKLQFNGVVLHCHGGGWLWGDSKYQIASRMLDMSETLHAVVISIDYRLTPQYTHPYAVQDVITVSLWLQENTTKEFGTTQIVASGESAGAHLLALATLELIQKQQQNRKCMFQCLNLVYGVYDLSGTPSVLRDGDTSSPLSGNVLQWLIDLYVPKSSSNLNRKDPTISPLYADLTNMPPALFTVGDDDPLLDDTLFMCQRYGTYGIDCELAVYKDGMHGIGHFGIQQNTSLGNQARHYTYQYLKRHFLSDGSSSAKK